MPLPERPIACIFLLKPDQLQPEIACSPKRQKALLSAILIVGLLSSGAIIFLSLPPDKSLDEVAILVLPLRQLYRVMLWTSAGASTHLPFITGTQTWTVYELPTDLVRLDAATISVDTDPKGMLKLGHSKDHRPDSPQFKVMMASLDPFALPFATLIVAGNSADDPLYLPAIAQVRKSIEKKGLLYVGDCKMSSLQTRHGIASGEDFYLSPLSAVQMLPEQLAIRFQPVLEGKRKLQEIWRTDSNGERILIAEGDEWVETCEQGDFRWQERRHLIRSVAFRRSASHALDYHLSAACQEIRKLGDHGKGKRPPRTPEAF